MLKILAGDWPADGNVTFKKGFSGQIKEVLLQKGSFSFDHLTLADIAKAEIVTAENRMSVGGKLGWGVAGAVLLGPVGAVIGGIAGGNAKVRVLAVEFRDGRKVVVKGKPKEIEPLLAAGYIAGGGSSG